MEDWVSECGGDSGGPRWRKGKPRRGAAVIDLESGQVSVGARPGGGGVKSP
jgi:hypothetical protein